MSLPFVALLGYNTSERAQAAREGLVGGQAFADRLRDIREAAGLSQAQLAEKAGMHRFGVSKLEQGLRAPSWATVQALAAALGVSCEEFQVAGEPAARATRKPRRRRGRPRKEK